MSLIRNPSNIINNIIRHEVQYDVAVADKIPVSADELTGIAVADDDTVMAFTVHDKQINSKKLIEGIASNSRTIPYIKDNKIYYRSIFKAPTVNMINTEIDSQDIISYSNRRTAPEKIYTKVIVKYHYDYELEEFQGSTEINDEPDSIIDIIDNATNGQPFQDFGNLDSSTYLESLGLTSEAEYTFEALYLRKAWGYWGSEIYYDPSYDYGAKELQKFLLLWHCNQHNILKLRLPLKYIQIGVGDLIGFDKMINNVKLFGEDYSLANDELVSRNGQQILPIWMVTSTNKTLTHIDIEMIQMHNCTPLAQDFPPTALINGEPGVQFISREAGTGNIGLSASESFDTNPEDTIVGYEWLDTGQVPAVPSSGSFPLYTETVNILNPDIEELGDAPYIENHSIELRVTSENPDGEQVVSDPAAINIQRIDHAQYVPPPLEDLPAIYAMSWWAGGFGDGSPGDHSPGDVPYAWQEHHGGYDPPSPEVFCVIGGTGTYPHPWANDGTFVPPYNYRCGISQRPMEWDAWVAEEEGRRLGVRWEAYVNFQPSGFSFDGGGVWLPFSPASYTMGYGEDWLVPAQGSNEVGQHSWGLLDWSSEGDWYDFPGMMGFDQLNHHSNAGITYNGEPWDNEIVEQSYRVCVFYSSNETEQEGVSVPELGHALIHIRSYPISGGTSTVGISARPVESMTN